MIMKLFRLTGHTSGIHFMKLVNFFVDLYLLLTILSSTFSGCLDCMKSSPDVVALL